MTKEERDKIKQEINSLQRILDFFGSGTYTRFCVTLLDDKSKKYADVNITDLDNQEDIIKVLTNRIKTLFDKLNKNRQQQI